MPFECDPPSRSSWSRRDDWETVLEHFVNSGRTDFVPLSTLSTRTPVYYGQDPDEITTPVGRMDFCPVSTTTPVGRTDFRPVSTTTPVGRTDFRPVSTTTPG